MKTLSCSALLILALTSTLAACGKSSAPKATTDTSTPPAAGTTKAGDAAPGKPGIVATCVKGTTTCVEYRNVLPGHVEEMCKAGPDYVFRQGPTPCPTEKVVGTCTNKLTPDETSYWYGTSPEDAELAKGLCEILGQWTPAPKGGAGAAAQKGPAPAGAKKAKR